MPSPDEHEDDESVQTVTLIGKHGTGETLLPGHLQVVVIGNGTFATHPLPDGAVVTIGRSSRCDLAIDDKSLSRRHATVKVGEAVTIEDLGSVNGTVVRGHQIAAGRPTAISVGELVSLGKVGIILQLRSRPARARRLYTHDYFATRLEEECARVQRAGGPFALLRIHPPRRAPASFVEEVLGELLRESDILSKYGAREYEALLPDTPPASADEAVARLGGNLLERGLKCRIFVACCPRDGQSTHELAARVQAQATANARRTPAAGTGVVVADVQMQGLHRLVEQVSASSIGVLLLGETGVGKEVFARALHRASPRAAGPFVEINCAALTETLLESELFGHEKGAFTHAAAAKPGLLEVAHGGTVLLDEIGDMPLSTQAKLLRVIEDSQLRRVGGLKPRTIDVRFVAATNAELEAQVARGAFRRDLFFRLNGITIVIPPLRERLAELEPLAQAFISRAWPRAGGPPPALAPGTLELLRAHGWPGNVRELKHVIERAVFLCGGGPIRPEHLPAALLADGPATASGSAARGLGSGDARPRIPDVQPLIEVPLAAPRRRGAEEQQWILQALDRAGGNQTLAARLLGISRRTLVNRLNDYKQVPRPRKDKKPPRDR